MSAPFFELRDVSVAYCGAHGALRALHGIDLTLKAGERLAIIGESGSGKSTLAMAMAELLPPQARLGGSVRHPALGRALRPGADIGVVFQDPSGSLNPVLSVGSQIAEVAQIHLGLSRGAAWERAVALLDRVRIPDAARRAHGYPHEFSGGQKQRIAIAAALAAAPKALIADEATSALDTVIQREILSLIDELVSEHGLTLVLVTHDIAIASQRADRVAVLYAGRMVETGPARETLAAPRHPYTRALLATHIGLDAPIHERLPEIPGTPPSPAQAGSGCPFLPRCPVALPRCAEPPPWVGDGLRGALCLRAGEVLP